MSFICSTFAAVFARDLKYRVKYDVQYVTKHV